MSWFLYAILTAFFDSLKVVFGKQSLQNLDIYLAGWAWRFFAFAILIPIMVILPMPALEENFWWAVLVSGTINLVVTPIYMRAIQASDLSLVMPMITFTPLFLLLTSPIIVGEFPTPMGLIGVIFIVAGAYLLNFDQVNKGILEPFKALLREQGPRLMLMVAFLWSISSNFDKIGMEASSPIYYSGALIGFLVIGLSPVVWLRSNRPIQKTRKYFWPLLFLGMSSGLVLVFQMLAIQLTLVAYVIAIKRMGAALSVIWGAIFFKEENLKARLPAVMIMLLGVAFITLGYKTNIL